MTDIRTFKFRLHYLVSQCQVNIGRLGKFIKIIVLDFQQKLSMESSSLSIVTKQLVRLCLHLVLAVHREATLCEKDHEIAETI